MPTAIEFNNVSKLYRLGLVSSGTLGNDLKRWWQMNILGKEDPFLKVGSINDRSTAADSDYVWALKDIDFKVEQGDVVGIIGKNGAGKSTLLKLLSKVTAPTTGTIKAKGRIASLLEVGTGFHPEMTGRENIYMNGTILGMTKKEIDGKLDEIVDFSGCERYIDTPVKRYSSGMTVRLGFAVAAHLDPEILVVDEVLAVGDAEFQKKAIGKMQDVSKGEGRTVLFVSHNMAAVKNLCHNGIVLKNGKIDFIGNVNDTLERYLNEQMGRSQQNVSDIKDRSGNGAFIFSNITFKDQFGNIRDTFKVGESMIIELDIDTTKKFNECKRRRVDIGINNIMGERVTWLSTEVFSDRFEMDNGKLRFQIPQIMLSEGNYNVNLFATIDDEVSDWVQQVARFGIEFHDLYNTGRAIPQNQGYIIMDFKII